MPEHLAEVRALHDDVTIATDDLEDARNGLKGIPAKLPANELDPNAMRAKPRLAARALQMVCRLLAYNAELDLARHLNTYLADNDEYRAITRNLLHLGEAASPSSPGGSLSPWTGRTLPGQPEHSISSSMNLGLAYQPIWPVIDGRSATGWSGDGLQQFVMAYCRRSEPAATALSFSTGARCPIGPAFTPEVWRAHHALRPRFRCRVRSRTVKNQS